MRPVRARHDLRTPARLVRGRSTKRALEEWPPPLRLHGPKGIPGHHGNGSGGRPLRAPALRRHRVGEAACRRDAPQGISQSVRRSTQKSALTRVLRNRLYCGDLVHLGKPQPGQHVAVISEETWRATQEAMAQSGARRSARNRYPFISVLRGLIFNESERALIHVGEVAPV
ncbi:hypothetical protein GO497_15335 [Acidovorax citrulli]|nr:hypothetical protein [Paracidovorax citrulli]